MKWTYEGAGVSLKAADDWIDIVKRAASIAQEGVISGIGGFSGLYDLGDDLCLAACCDGVGTKLEIAKKADQFAGLGQDLVAMNVNDLITCGARPLFFLDYIACGKLDGQRFSGLIYGIAEACRQSGCALLGGETAEMPGTYPPDGFDLAGFAVGLAKKSKLITGQDITAGDLLVGLPSSGLHSNGFSLVRKVLLEDGLKLSLDSDPLGEGRPLYKTLLEPTRLYPGIVAKIMEKVRIKAMAHITGGGLEGNVMRVIPEGLAISVDYSSWKRPKIYDLIAKAGVEEGEMRKVFNLGIGFVLVIERTDLSGLEDTLKEMNEPYCVIGEVITA
ncbi:MAG TPA: phosphoribosylformylglycinamidine cyclo-ligase [Acetomicrobium flavidum]|uniref:phosphoribosylformylglycinamidine cyclo-ligase n=1 Tax=Acetomicrobium flavidum TaxID=49896 RepID=UPI002BE3F5DA|nr:phosphoribosylformylglycinamidine cyclo-ligase [Acetomicrobium flavidum]HOM31355.1 phosphoribosylformylglycinamidine cyclo-ligase [Acetomicrobium flavidum]HOP87782.1 phosphoribosylformylglycinamidine cyclo-ligase [Acetomicrobium flavidum]HPP14808.1 phosphoribosylformylglycinamidine cyclo-ligase [Acetomicrobium flavidum]